MSARAAPPSSSNKKSGQSVNINSVFGGRPAGHQASAHPTQPSYASRAASSFGGTAKYGLHGLQPITQTTNVVKRRLPKPVSLPSAPDDEDDDSIVESGWKKPDEIPTKPATPVENQSNLLSTANKTTSGVTRPELQPKWMQQTRTSSTPQKAEFPSLSAANQQRPTSKPNAWAHHTESHPIPVTQEEEEDEDDIDRRIPANMTFNYSSQIQASQWHGNGDEGRPYNFFFPPPSYHGHMEYTSNDVRQTPQYAVTRQWQQQNGRHQQYPDQHYPTQLSNNDYGEYEKTKADDDDEELNREMQEMQLARQKLIDESRKRQAAIAKVRGNSESQRDEAWESSVQEPVRHEAKPVRVLQRKTITTTKQESESSASESEDDEDKEQLVPVSSGTQTVRRRGKEQNKNAEQKEHQRKAPAPQKAEKEPSPTTPIAKPAPAPSVNVWEKRAAAASAVPCREPTPEQQTKSFTLPEKRQRAPLLDNPPEHLRIDETATDRHDEQQPTNDKHPRKRQHERAERSANSGERHRYDQQSQRGNSYLSRSGQSSRGWRGGARGNYASNMGHWRGPEHEFSDQQGDKENPNSQTLKSDQCRMNEFHDESRSGTSQRGNRNTRGSRGGAQHQSSRNVGQSKVGTSRSTRGGFSQRTNERRDLRGQKGNFVQNKEKSNDFLTAAEAGTKAKSPPTSDGHEEWETASESSDPHNRANKYKQKKNSEKSQSGDKDVSLEKKTHAKPKYAAPYQPRQQRQRHENRAMARAGAEQNNATGSEFTKLVRNGNTAKSTGAAPMSKNAQAASRTSTRMAPQAGNSRVPQQPLYSKRLGNDAATTTHTNTTGGPNRALRGASLSNVDLSSANVVVIDHLQAGASPTGKATELDEERQLALALELSDDFELVCSKREKRARMQREQQEKERLLKRDQKKREIQASKRSERLAAKTKKSGLLKPLNNSKTHAEPIEKTAMPLTESMKNHKVECNDAEQENVLWLNKSDSKTVGTIDHSKMGKKCDDKSDSQIHFVFDSLSKNKNDLLAVNKDLDSTNSSPLDSGRPDAAAMISSRAVGGPSLTSSPKHRISGDKKANGNDILKSAVEKATTAATSSTDQTSTTATTASTGLVIMGGQHQTIDLASVVQSYGCTGNSNIEEESFKHRMAGLQDIWSADSNNVTQPNCSVVDELATPKTRSIFDNISSTTNSNQSQLIATVRPLQQQQNSAATPISSVLATPPNIYDKVGQIFPVQHQTYDTPFSSYAAPSPLQQPQVHMGVYGASSTPFSAFGGVSLFGSPTSLGNQAVQYSLAAHMSSAPTPFLQTQSQHVWSSAPPCAQNLHFETQQPAAAFPNFTAPPPPVYHNVSQPPPSLLGAIGSQRVTTPMLQSNQFAMPPPSSYPAFTRQPPPPTPLLSVNLPQQHQASMLAPQAQRQHTQLDHTTRHSSAPMPPGSVVEQIDKIIEEANLAKSKMAATSSPSGAKVSSSSTTATNSSIH